MRRRLPCAYLVSAAFASTACTTAEEAFAEGDYLEARRTYHPEACAVLPAHGAEAQACIARVEEIDRAIDHAVRVLGERANDLTARRVPLQFRDYPRAAQCLRLAIGLMSPEDARRAEYTAGIERLESTVESLGLEYDDQVLKLEQLLGEPELPEEIWHEVRRAFERVRLLRMAIRRPDDRPAALALRYADVLRRRGQNERARVAGDLALAVERRGAEFPTTEQLDDQALVRLALLDYRGEREAQQRHESITRLSAELDHAQAEGRTDIVQEKARALLALEPERSVAKRLRHLLASAEPGAARGTVAAGAGGAGGPPKAAVTGDVAPVRTRAEASVAVATGGAKGGPAEPDLEPEIPDLPARPVGVSGTLEEASLAEARALEEGLVELTERFEKGDEYAALVGLESLIRVYEGSPHQTRALRLRELWEPDRRRVLREAVREADRLFVAMDDGSLAEYERALRLGPVGPVRAHIEERIGTLRRIIAQ